MLMSIAPSLGFLRIMRGQLVEGVENKNKLSTSVNIMLHRVKTIIACDIYQSIVLCKIKSGVS